MKEQLSVNLEAYVFQRLEDHHHVLNERILKDVPFNYSLLS